MVEFPLEIILTYCWSTIAVTIITCVGLFLGTELSGYNSGTLATPVNRNNCTCDCWDGFYRGLHKRGGYKSLYFNYELQTILLFGIFLFYTQLLRYFIVKIVTIRQIKLLLLILPIYSNYYGIWAIINYINDHDYHRMLPSQTFFSITELVATYLFYECLVRQQSKTILEQSMICLLATICSLHLLLALGELNVPRIARNVALVLSDIIPLSWAILTLIHESALRPDGSTTGLWVVVGFVLWLFYHIFCPYRD